MDTIIQIGADIGQVQDPTAIAVAEISRVPTGRPERASLYTIRHIKRLPLYTSYPHVAAYIVNILCNEIFLSKHVRLFIDITGVGRPVFDDIRQAIELKSRQWRNDGQARQIVLKPITFTSGKEYNQQTGSLGKAFMVSRLQSLLQNERLHAPNIPEVAALQEELKVFEIRVSQAGHDSYGAMQSGMHDDMVTALGLACLEDSFATGAEAHLDALRERVALMQKRAFAPPEKRKSWWE